MTDYEKICDFQNLYKAHVISRRGKRHKAEVIEFELNLSSSLTRLKEQLDKRTYKMRGYYDFIIREPKERRIYASHYSDRVVQHCLCDEVLKPVIQKRLIHDNAACQPGKGTHFALNRLSGFIREHYKKNGANGYFLKCDISKYFASIDHAVLKENLVRIVKDEEVRNLLFLIIDSFASDGTPEKGLPLGNQTSQWFAIYYLDPVDRMIKERLRIKHYVRYMDDLILVHPDKAYLKKCLDQIRELAEGELKLKLNEKTQIFPLKNGVQFLGFHFYLSDSGKVIRKLKVQSKIRYKRRLVKLQKDYADGLIDLDKVKNVLASYKGHLMHGHTYKLKEKVMRDFVLKREYRQ